MTRKPLLSEKMKAKIAAMDPKKAGAIRKVLNATQSYSPEVIDVAYDCFQYQANDEGQLTREKVQSLMKECGVRDGKVLDRLCRAWECDFVKFMITLERAKYTDKYGFMFDTFDLNGDGFFGVEELFWILKSGAEFQKEEYVEEKIMADAEELFARLKNNCGYISRDDFIGSFSESAFSRRPSIDSLGISINSDIFHDFGMKFLVRAE